ncbi:MAG TPA: hypothetical protein VND93_23225 [Myxococcales bacterium]|jgi:hypothetical protein|nr:hypothetical protein [Myxococcales bacterium]
MVELIQEFGPEVVAADERRYVARMYAAQRASDLHWDAWLVFFPLDGGSPVVGDRETTQSSREDLVFWASGVEPVYLEGALERGERARQTGLFRLEAWGGRAAELVAEEEVAYQMGREHVLNRAAQAPATVVPPAPAAPSGARHA